MAGKYGSLDVGNLYVSLKSVMTAGSLISDHMAHSTQPVYGSSILLSPDCVFTTEELYCDMRTLTICDVCTSDTASEESFWRSNCFGRQITWS